ncbi:acetyltransferase [Chromobacterium vaccinii]|uniref:acetyltransferase n=1 Tax=Chromobacterium vaccinii TaxID=1108595 RepID=UPI001E50BBB1|nr:acetyltransferase [Chromobacterium vaccinii]MCD4498924.1 acetyltransferase [Chromobacterium vaccinii]
MSLPVIVIGAGGHAVVVADALLEAGVEVLGYTDPDPSLHGSRRLGLPVLGGDEALAGYVPERVWLVNGMGFVSGSGRTAARARAQQRLQAQGWTFAPVIHPRALVSRHATLAADAQVLAGAIVQAGARIGVSTIINTAAVVEHDAIVGAWCHVATRATLCGQTHVGDGCLIGAGAVLRQSVSVGADTVIGAGAVVLRDSAGGEIVCGVPARPLGVKR